jgi:hypothetical protein
MDENIIDIDDECSESEQEILNNNINNCTDETDEENQMELEIVEDNIFDDDMIILEISLTPDDFKFLKENKMIIGEGDNCILILNKLMQKNDKSINFLNGFLLGLLYSKYYINK